MKTNDNNNRLFYQKGGVKKSASLRSTLKYVQVCVSAFNLLQFQEIKLGLENLSVEQVQVYAHPNFNEGQMYAIRRGFENGLSMEQVEFYAKPKFNCYQMEEIRLGFQNGLSMEQVQFYAKPNIKYSKMRKKRTDLERELNK